MQFSQTTNGGDNSIPNQAMLDPIVLFHRAKDAARHAHCIYSNFPVGAALSTREGQIFVGANIENSSFGLTNCAERSALFSAVSNGSSHIEALAIYTPTLQPTFPCGACRQVLSEIAPDATIYVFCKLGLAATIRVEDLLPFAFSEQSLTNEATRGPRPGATRRRSICVDIDNVLCQSDIAMRQIIRDVTHGNVNLAYEDICRFNYFECTDQKGNVLTRDQWREVHSRFSSALIIESLVPMPDSIECLSGLSKDFTIHIATARLPTARRPTLDWLNRQDLPEFDLHFLKHGEKHAALGHFDISVEDDLDQAIAFAKAGFGLNIVLAHPWNSTLVESPYLKRAANWTEVAQLVAATNSTWDATQPRAE